MFNIPNATPYHQLRCSLFLWITIPVWVMLRPVAGVLSIYLTISIKNSFITKQNTLTLQCWTFGTSCSYANALDRLNVQSLRDRRRYLQTAARKWWDWNIIKTTMHRVICLLIISVVVWSQRTELSRSHFSASLAACRETTIILQYFVLRPFHYFFATLCRCNFFVNVYNCFKFYSSFLETVCFRVPTRYFRDFSVFTVGFSRKNCAFTRRVLRTDIACKIYWHVQ
jgi:hypothetical protein